MKVKFTFKDFSEEIFDFTEDRWEEYKPFDCLILFGAMEAFCLHLYNRNDLKWFERGI
jgi:hypothetical protein